MAAQVVKRDYYWIHVTIGLAFMFLFGRFIPPIEPITAVGMQVVGIFIGMIYLWTTCGTLWPSLLGVVALGMSDYCSMAKAIQEGLGNTTFWILLNAFILTNAITTSGCGMVLSKWMITRKFLKGKPLLFIFVLLFTFFIASGFLGATMMIIFGFALAETIAKQLDYQKGDKTIDLLTFGLHIACMVGLGLVPFRGMRLALCSAFGNAAGQEINTIQYMLIAFLTGVVFVGIYTLAVKFIFKADLSKIKNVDLDELSKDVRKLTFNEKAYLIGFLVVIIYMLLVTVLPSNLPFYPYLNLITQNSIFAAVIIVLCIMRHEGKPVLDFAQCAKNMKWNPLLIVAAALPIASALTSEATGVSQMMMKLLGPVFLGRSPWQFCILVVLASLILTNIGNNVAMGTMLIPILVPFIEPLGVNAAAIGIVMVFLINFGIMTPGASGPGALIFANEWFTPGRLYKYLTFGFVLMILIAIVFTLPLSYVICR